MARYRRVETRVWTDARVRKLSKPPPCGQFLWMRLLTGPETTIIPGVIVTGRAGLAEKLEWPIVGFNSALGELVSAGLVCESLPDGLLWVPNAVKHNPPQNPNVVIAWGKEWPEVPECDLKARIHCELHEHIEGFSEGFRNAFSKAFGNPLAKEMESFAESGTGSRSRIQEQENEASEPSGLPTEFAPSPKPPSEPSTPPGTQCTGDTPKAQHGATSQASDGVSAALAKPKSTPRPPPREALELAQFLYDAIRSHSPQFMADAKPASIATKLTGWARDIDRGLRLDGMTAQGARDAIDAAHRSDDTFWRGNLLSGAKLRKHYEALRIKKGNAPTSPGKPGEGFDYVGAGNAWAAAEAEARGRK